MRITKKNTHTSGSIGLFNNTHSYTMKTPRGEYYDNNFTECVTLLENNELFQVSFNNASQFYNYVNIIPKKSQGNYPDCVIQSLFAIGLRNIDALRIDVDNILKHKFTIGVYITDLIRYIEKSWRCMG